MLSLVVCLWQGRALLIAVADIAGRPGDKNNQHKNHDYGSNHVAKAMV
jgi:hypothetical protein